MVSRMKHNLIALVVLGCLSLTVCGQESQPAKNPFWEKVQFGGGVGISFNNNNFQANLSPTALYRPNRFVAFGPSVLFSYQDNDLFRTTVYGVSGIVLANPIHNIQLSAEIEQLFGNRRGNDDFNLTDTTINNTAFFVGAGYNFNGISIGVRYNLLFDEEDGIFASAFQPFFRVFF